MALLVQDTTEVDLTCPNDQVTGAGPLDDDHRYGAFVHPLLAMNSTACGSATAKFIDSDGQPVVNHPGADLFFVLTPGVSRYNGIAMRFGLLAADSDFVTNVDRHNHELHKTDSAGQATYAALIPGATYQFRVGLASNAKVKSFVAESGHTTDLGEFTVERIE